MEDYLITECGVSPENAQEEMEMVRNKGWTTQEIRQYFIDKYGLPGFASVWEECAYKKQILSSYSSI